MVYKGGGAEDLALFFNLKSRKTGKRDQDQTTLIGPQGKTHKQ